MNQWRKGIASWQMGKNLYLSVPFTWLLQEARMLAQAHKGPVFAGGPAVSIMPALLEDVAILDEPCPIPPLMMHNPLATFTTRGCPKACPWCIVPKIEGDLKELDDWPVRPVICDNNLLGASRKHFDRVIDKLKAMPYVDFNQGLDATRFTPHHARRIGELKGVKLRFAFDTTKAETATADAFTLARKHGLKDFGCYVLIGFNDTPDEAQHRLELVRSWDVLPNPMRYEPLDALEQGRHVGSNWTDWELKRMMRYYSRLIWLGHVPYSDYKPRQSLF